MIIAEAQFTREAHLCCLLQFSHLCQEGVGRLTVILLAHINRLLDVPDTALFSDKATTPTWDLKHHEHSPSYWHS